MVNYPNAFRRPFTDTRKMLLGSFLYMVPFVNIITGFFVSGYTLSCAKKAMVDDYQLPRWSDWGALFVTGILAFVISMIYFLPAFILAYLFGGTDLMLGMMGITAMPEFSNFFLIPLVFMIIGTYLVPYALMIFVDEGNFKSAFAKIIPIAEKVFTLKYLVPWLVAVIYSGIVLSAAYFLNFYLEFTYVLPFIITGFALFITGVTAMSIFGALYTDIERKTFKFKL